jgi:hypothetical protein
MPSAHSNFAGKKRSARASLRRLERRHDADGYIICDRISRYSRVRIPSHDPFTPDFSYDEAVVRGMATLIGHQTLVGPDGIALDGFVNAAMWMQGNAVEQSRAAEQLMYRTPINSFVVVYPPVEGVGSDPNQSLVDTGSFEATDLVVQDLTQSVADQIATDHPQTIYVRRPHTS